MGVVCGWWVNGKSEMSTRRVCGSCVCVRVRVMLARVWCMGGVWLTDRWVWSVCTDHTHCKSVS